MEKVIEKGSVGCTEELKNEYEWTKPIKYGKLSLEELKCPLSSQIKSIRQWELWLVKRIVSPIMLVIVVMERMGILLDLPMM